MYGTVHQHEHQQQPQDLEPKAYSDYHQSHWYHDDDHHDRQELDRQQDDPTASSEYPDDYRYQSRHASHDYSGLLRLTRATLG